MNRNTKFKIISVIAYLFATLCALCAIFLFIVKHWVIAIILLIAALVCLYIGDMADGEITPYPKPSQEQF